MKLFWQGTDSLMLNDYSMRKWKKRPYWWVFRRLVRMLDLFIEEHYCDSENVAENVRRFGTKRPIKVRPDDIDMRVYEKIPHDTFTVLYYFPTGHDQSFMRWLYGKDIFDEVVSALPKLRYVVVNGKNDMQYVYPYVDFYLRPNRHDGASRMRQECELNNIPYYWTQKDPSIGDAIKAVKDELESFNKV